jgi:hypothetical protein
MARGKTQKRRSKTNKISVKTIPELRKALDHVRVYAEGLIKKGGGSVTKEKAREFASEWKKAFGKSMSVKAAEEYLVFLKCSTNTKKKLGHTRKLRGGAQSTQLTGAPMDYLTRPGTDIPYGNFLKYVDSGFTNPEPAIQADCGKQTAMLPFATTGSNKMNGGGFLSAITAPMANFAQAITTRPFVAINPPSVGQDAQTTWKGQPLGPGPNSYDVGYKYQTLPGSRVTVLTSDVYDRDLTRDITMSQGK